MGLDFFYVVGNNLFSSSCIQKIFIILRLYVFLFKQDGKSGSPSLPFNRLSICLFLLFFFKDLEPARICNIMGFLSFLIAFFLLGCLAFDVLNHVTFESLNLFLCILLQYLRALIRISSVLIVLPFYKHRWNFILDRIELLNEFIAVFFFFLVLSWFLS